MRAGGGQGPEPGGEVHHPIFARVWHYALGQDSRRMAGAGGR